MKQINIGGKKGIGKFLLVDDDIYEELKNNYSWSLDKDGYAQTYIRGTWNEKEKTGKKGKAHRIITNCPKGMEVDHKNGDKLDCRRDNLRIVNKSQNLMNQRKTRGSSKYKGVYLYKNNKNPCWAAQINLSGKVTGLGYFESEIDAAKAYDKRAKQEFGEYAKLNLE